jgi:uncharacterized UPF0146 family protein
VRRSTVAALTDYLARYDRVVEVGIGRRTAVAEALTRADTDVAVTDVHSRTVPESVRFVEDDIVARARSREPVPDVYDVDAVYALNLPPELHRPTRDVAHRAGADFLFTTLGGDHPAVSVDAVTLDEETLYVAVPTGRRVRRARRRD